MCAYRAGRIITSCWFLGAMFVCAAASAITIDDFSSGAYSASSPGDWTEFTETQTGLDPGGTIGGSRALFGMYGGAFEISVGSEDRLVFDHNRGQFEVASLTYGSFMAGGSELNSDLTAGGADHLLIRIAEMQEYEPTTSWAGEHRLNLSFRSDATGGSPGWGSVGIPLPESSEPYTLAIPMDTLVTPNGLDWSDIDGIQVSFAYNNRKRLVIDSIETGFLDRGDLNGDGVVNDTDAYAFARFYGSTAPVAADANRDGIVNAADYTLWRDARSASTTVIVPEPAAALLGLLACLLGAPPARRSLC